MLFVKSLTELGLTDLNVAGGKGANLGALLRAGLPVPPGFCVTTDAYRAFVETNHLQSEILRLADSVKADDLASLETLSARICALFVDGDIPDELAFEIRSAYAALADSPSAVAVRSSATAEDLPELSFAGQQDTYLNIVGEAAVLEAVKRCWGSLWTARAIGYRARNQISQSEIALAVVIQRMIPSEVSGVLFTANPLTGKRTETVIDATLGLGEALVSGQVDPDHYVVDTITGQIIDKALGAKSISIRGQAAGGTIKVAEVAADRQALPDARIIELARLGNQSAEYFGAPQDIEWAWAEGHLYLVQSRPITSLYPLPKSSGDAALRVWFSFGVWQGMLDPFTPLGQDIFTGLVVGIAQHLGSPLTIETQRVLVQAGERLFVDITGLIRHPVGRQVLRQFISAIDPATSEALESLCADSRLSLQARRMKLHTLARLARLFAPLIFNVIFNLASPARGRARLQQRIDAGIRDSITRQAATTTLADRVALFESELMQQPSAWLPFLLPAVISGQVVFQALLRSSAGLPDGETLVMELTRGLPHNVTTEMDLALWATARAIHADGASTQHFSQVDAAALATDYLAGRLPTVAQKSVEHFVEQYGVRGIGEIDIGRPRWHENPAHIMQVLKSYLQIERTDSSPEIVFKRGAAQAEEAGERLIDSIRRLPRGGLSARQARWKIKRVRELVGLRETPKFAVIRLLDVLRRMLMADGQALVLEGMLTRADDLFFLHLSELKALAAHEPRDWRALIAERRQIFAREMRRRQLPRLLLSDGTAFYEGVRASAGAGVLVGSPVSAGVVEGIVHVILDSREAQLAPGEILVCPATDPAWTPLFLTAGGLVMEVGGMMTHGSVVAREYGIPAVVGVNQATTRLKTGQHIRVDGSTGQIVILDMVQ